MHSYVAYGLVLTGMYVSVPQKRAEEDPLGLGQPPCGSEIRYEILVLQARCRAQCQEAYL